MQPEHAGWGCASARSWPPHSERRSKTLDSGMVTITDVRVGADLRDAVVFYTVYGDDLERADSAAALESARGVLRTRSAA